MIGIAHRGTADPIFWKTLPNGDGSGADVHSDVVERFLTIVDPEAVQTVLANREFIGMEWLQALHEQGIPFAIRLCLNRRIRPQGESPGRGPALPIRIVCSARCTED